MSPLVGTLLTFYLAQPPAADAVRDRLDAYLREYEPLLSTLVGTEDMTQSIDARDNGSGGTSFERPRRLRSEVAFVALPGSGGLIGFRRVVAVDGKTIDTSSTSLADLLRTNEPNMAAQRLLEESARYNLGQPRTTNMPSLPLELLHPRHRQRFTHRLAGHQRIRGTDASILVAEENVTPSLVRGSDGRDSPSLVRAWVDGRGRLLRAEVRLRGARTAGRLEPTIRVEFGQNDALGLLVPIEMRETFWTPSRLEGNSVAKYSAYRRFRTAARIVPPDS